MKKSIYMASTYTNAFLTIFAVQDNGADYDLRGVKGVPEPRRFTYESHYDYSFVGIGCSGSTHMPHGTEMYAQKILRFLSPRMKESTS